MDVMRKGDLPVNVVFPIGWKVIVDDQRDLLDIDTASQQVGSNEDTRGSGTELTHDHVTLLLIHVTVLEANGKYIGLIRPLGFCMSTKAINLGIHSLYFG